MSSLTTLGAVPYFTLPTIDLGPLELQPFGILVAIGVLVGAWVARKRAETLNLDEDHLRSLVGWVLVTGFVGAHVFDVLAYQPDKLREDPLLLFKVWAGISSYGGFLGGTAGFFYYIRKRALPVVPYADAMMWGLLVGFTFGRVGCSVVHDHIGAPADDFFLAMEFPADVAYKYGITPGTYHELGLYELVYLLVVIAALYLVTRAVKVVGLNLAFVPIAYAPARFFLDFLRVNQAMDPRYLGLTFAQWTSILTAALGVAVAVYLVKHGRREGDWAAEMGARAEAEAQRRAAGAGDVPKSDLARAKVERRKGAGKPGAGKKRKKK